jgi:hypothetical protein
MSLIQSGTNANNCQPTEARGPENSNLHGFRAATMNSAQIDAFKDSSPTEPSEQEQKPQDDSIKSIQKSLAINTEIRRKNKYLFEI